MAPTWLLRVGLLHGFFQTLGPPKIAKTNNLIDFSPSSSIKISLLVFNKNVNYAKNTKKKLVD